MTWPDPIKTTKRCQMSLPEMFYNCRRLGKYPLQGKHYCAPHYSLTWEILNPVHGPQCHFQLRLMSSGDPWPYQTCIKCGAIKLREGLPQKPCKGHEAKIQIWAN